MRRNWDIIRAHLLSVEAGKLTSEGMAYFEADKASFNGHHDLIASAGFIEQDLVGGWPLTMAGHDLLDLIRDEAVWATTKRWIEAHGGCFIEEIVQETAYGVVRYGVAETNAQLDAHEADQSSADREGAATP